MAPRTKPSYIVIPTDWMWSTYDSPEEAVQAATERIQKNQRCFAGSRETKQYYIAKVVTIVRPSPPVPVDVDIERFDEQSED